MSCGLKPTVPMVCMAESAVSLLRIGCLLLLCACSTSAACCPRPQVLKTSTVGNTFSNLGRQLLDGHWVLSFIDADRCAAARDLVDAGQVRKSPRHPP